ncbi:MAG: DUF427 domain-containing protein [Chromatiaceae bacterium]|uniref:DUF427 domain-containing protein n=1 Tax=Phenylobacterium sp. TaxID=1871053 RepID=UPI001B60A0C0|nr:DUF427 domain-containing protein [Phenylobacterium sp.]MBP7815507.1 DUF427 domain-containing protein [Phenylobacterium sp.]MBP8290360.1 DUF427 domain-containing protein [Chromatiaceae bacterium]MBP9755157.1 DUF427 domain-containing protein [Phenylobacterium sp.]
MKIPGPDHPITISPGEGRWRVKFAGHVIADSNDAVVLKEAAYKPAVYFPREDVSMEFFSRTDRSTHCPYKGDAAYYTVLMDGDLAENGVWTYEEPFPAMEQIRGRLAFYPDRFEIYAVDDDTVDPTHVHTERHAIDEAVQHTDSGSGASQKQHWPANTNEPPRPEGV